LEAWLMLCDAAQLVQGKLYILGGGWDRTSVNNPSLGVAFSIMIEWTETNQRHRFELELQDEDGNALMVGEPPKPLIMGGDFTAGRPAEHPPGMPLWVRQAVNIQNPRFEPNKRYRWELRINGSPLTNLSFYTAG